MASPRFSPPLLSAALLILGLSLAACLPGASPPVAAAENCANGVDDDGNGRTDCADPACFRDAACAPAVEVCDNGVDDDGNGLVDCKDTVCGSLPACAPGVEQCAGGVDEDQDGKVDCEDVDCANAGACQAKEACKNNADDNANGLVDCADPGCAQDPACPSAEASRCANGVDDDGDGALDCADADCAAACSPAENGEAACSNGVDDDGDGKADCADGSCVATLFCSRESACADGLDNDNDGKKDCADPDCGPAAPCVGTAELCSDGLDNDGDTQTDCADTLDCNGKACGTGCICSGGQRSEQACSDGIDNDFDGVPDCQDSNCAGLGLCNGNSSEAGKCGDGLDNDADTQTDCADTADCPAGASCGAGCVCASQLKKEASCGDGADNDGDAKVDCADPDCLGVVAESCADGKDNDCDGQTDCADPQCATQPGCTLRDDGQPCTLDSQCKGARCYSEAVYGFPGGACSNATTCTVGTNAGCNGGTCVESGTFDTCYAACSGAGLAGGAGACRTGYSCMDVDLSPTNNNNFCTPLCTSDAECLPTGNAADGCNPYSKLCERKSNGLAVYGAACAKNGDCESGFCLTPNGASHPGGYCSGLCNASAGGCGGDGQCIHDSAWGDNTGICYDGCTGDAQCRAGTAYTCQTVVSTLVCYCRGTGQACTVGTQCCSGLCSPDMISGASTCN